MACKPPFKRHKVESDPTLYEDRIRNWSPAYNKDQEVLNTDSMYKSVRTLDDTVTPCFKQLISKGVVINNPCKIYHWTSSSHGESHLTFIWKADTAYWFTYEGGSGTRSQGGAAFIGNQQANIDVKASRKATAECIAQVNATPYAFGEDVGEIFETIKFVRNPFTSLNELAKSFSKEVNNWHDKKRKTKTRAKAIADVYATYQWAFKPLVRSAYDAADAYTQPQKGSYDVRHTARGFESVKGSSSDTVEDGAGRTFYVSGTKEIDSHASLLYRVTNPIRDHAYKLGLRPRDIPETLWQLFPYSFMIDRVVDVSSFVRGFTNLTAPEVEILAGSIRTKTTLLDTVQLATYEDPLWTIEVLADEYREKRFTYNRRPWTPSVFDSVPNSDIANLVNSASKIADLGALILQRLR